MVSKARSIPAEQKAKTPVFHYEQAFSRNIGWLTDWEQQILREKRIAIAGMGGVGGIHLQTLTRLGVGRFSISDMDRFELANFNRQVAATLQTIGQPKVHAAAEMARNINPELDLRIFSDGVSLDNLDAFLADVDLYVDSLDYFAFDIRRAIFQRCYELNIPAVTAAPIGIGTGYLVFMPGGMCFQDYFQFAESGNADLPVDFLLGLTPAMLQRPYLADSSRVNLEQGAGPSTAMACQLCAGVAGAEAVKILLKRGPIKAVPYYHHFDAYRGRFVVAQLPMGNKGPLQSLKRYFAARLVRKLAQHSRPPEVAIAADADVMDHVLDAARWAPSGDNAQPWRFLVRSAQRVDVELDLEAQNVYQYRSGEPNWLALGMLLEAMSLAANHHQHVLHWLLVEESDRTARVQVDLSPAPRQSAPLYPWLKIRSVDRRSYKTTPVQDDVRTHLQSALGYGFTVTWHMSLWQRFKMARLSAKATSVRLRIPETFGIHQRVIDWANAFSRTGLPARASGLSPFLQPLMRWALGSYTRMRVLTQGLRGRWLAQLDLDWIPGLRSSGYFALHQNIDKADKLRNIDRLIMGQRLMRFWLEATRLGLAIQPSIAPLCFSIYGQDKTPFTKDKVALDWARTLASAFSKSLGSVDTIFFMGRIGYPRSLGQTTRSLRQPLQELIKSDARADTLKIRT